MRLLIFLIFSQHGLACKYRIIFQIPISNNCQSGKPITEIDSICFFNKRFFSLAIFEVDFVLKIKDKFVSPFLT